MPDQDQATAAEDDAASALLEISKKNDQPQDPIATPLRKSATASRVDKDKSPVRRFQLVDRKRERDDLVTVIYTSGQQTMAIPYARGEPPELFFERRAKAARLLFDSNREDVYCTWRHMLVNMCVKHDKWILFKNTLAQKRYCFEAIQLIVTRYTCGQWNKPSLCRNCQNRQWRTSCLQPTYLHHLMPLPKASTVATNMYAACESALHNFEAIDVERDPSDWTTRMPQMVTRQ